MRITARAYAGGADLDRMAALVYAHPAHAFHVADLPYRLSSPALETAANGQVWVAADGALRGWAVYQPPWGTLDYAVHPAANAGLEREILAWGLARFQQLAQEYGRALDYYVDAHEDDAARIALLEQHGFARDDYHVVHLGRSLADPIPPPEVPAGFTLRPLAGAGEVAAYVATQRAAFGSTHMTGPWRQRTLAMPQYQPDLDLVIAAPDGRVAAFCVGWLSPVAPAGRRLAQVEPMGVHPDFQRLGLGRAVLAEMLRRMQTHGTDLAIVETYSTLDPAQALYDALGFRLHYRVLKYFRTF